MGFEIKNICTVVPNPHHPNYKDRDNFYYFSLFITPRLQFDGKLKEFYEMLNWHEYQDLFKTDSNGKLTYFNLFGKGISEFSIDIFNDETISCIQNQKLNFDEKLWKKLFHKDVPVEAWPIYLKPQVKIDLKEEKILNDEIEKSLRLIREDSAFVQIKELISPFHQNLSDFLQELSSAIYTISESESKKELIEKFELIENNNNKLKKLQDTNQKKNDEQFQSNKYRQEFHKKVSALSRYPHLLRMLGLIHDFKIQAAQLNKAIQNNKTFLIRLNVNLNEYFADSEGNIEQKKMEFTKSVQFLCPNTKCSINETSKRLIAFDKLVKDGIVEENYGSIVRDGFLRCLSDEGNLVFSVDQEYLENETKNFNVDSDTKSSTIGFNRKSFEVEDVEILKQKVEKVNTYSKGISIKVFAQAAKLLTTMDEAFNNLNDENIESDDSPFLAYHLDCGYRVDVKAIPPGKKSEDFRSLCLRKATYTLDKNKIINFNPEKGSSPLFGKPTRDKLFNHPIFDEPWLEEVRQTNNKGESSRFEEIARWTGWSLTCPPLHAKNQPNPEYDDLELEEIRPINLPKLRFGWIYQFRIRTVDICGNGPCLSSNENGLEESTFTVTYDRKEPVSPPLFFPTDQILLNNSKATDKNENKTINLRFKGEDNETLVIRSKVRENGEIEKLIDDSCVRFITPSQVSPHFAEVSGLWDSYWFPSDKENKENLYDFLSAKAQTFYNEKEIQGKIPFPFDPKVIGVKIYDNNELKGTKKNSIYYFRKDEKGKLLETTKPIKLILNKGKEQYSKNLIKLNLIEGGIKAKWIASCDVNGQNSKRKKFQLIHAVQRPYFINRIENSCISQILKFKKIAPNPAENPSDSQKYEAKLEIDDVTVLLPFQTTGEIILTAQYNEYVLNPENEKGWSYISKDFPIEKNKKLLKGINEDKMSQADNFYIQKSWSNLKPTEDNDNLETQLGDSVKLKEIIESDIFDGFKHTFPDTKFREVNYSLELVSKFQSFFDIEHHKLKGPKPFSRQIKLGSHSINNSSKPSKPNITSIVPIFHTKTGKTTYTFEHTTFRIYLGKTWYETGLGEKIAVIHDKSVNSIIFNKEYGLPQISDSDSTVNSLYFKNKISIFANDPTVHNDDSISIFKNNKSYIDTLKLHESYESGDSTLKVNVNLFESTIESPNEIPGGNTNQVFSVFDVKWDKQEGQFFCDIILNPEAFKSYTRLTKFAICRYQENSIKSDKYDYRFSDVVMTDMVSIQPKRSVVFKDGKVCVTGIMGSRNSKRKNSEEIYPNENILYLISEKIDRVDDTKVSNLVNGKDFFAETISFGKTVKLNDTNHINSFTIEEYEYIKLNDDFKNVDNPVNPRNDPSKRLVFFYKLPKT